MGGSYEFETDGDYFTVDLTPEIDRPFAGNTGAIRNFTAQTESVTTELFYYLWVDDYDRIYVEDNIRLTLTPLNGGETFTRFGKNFPGGFGLNDLPVGSYEVSAEYVESGEESIPLYVRLRHTEEYADSTVFKFETFVEGIYRAELEFWLDN